MRKHLSLLAFAAISLLLLSTAAVAKSQTTKSTEEIAVQRKVGIPPQAQKLDEDTYYLGKTKDKNGQDVEGYMYIHTNRQNSLKAGTTSCYTYLAKSAKWKVVEDYLVDPTNSEGLSPQFVKDTVGGSIAKWEDATDGTVDSVLGINVMGGEGAGTVDGVDEVAPDDKNEVLFGDFDSAGVIAVTIVWGRFGGPLPQRELVEWDMLVDEVDFDWSGEANGVPGKMDLDNIVTHEEGHAFGMGHPANTCVDETMYAYADYGETKKRDLNSGDIAGINKLY